MFRRPNNPSLALREPRWTVLERGRLPGASADTHAWLSDSGSLTRSVVARCRSKFGVEVVRQVHESAWPSEIGLLGGGPAQATLVREVRLRCGRDAWVFARTLLPMASLRGPLRALTHLGRRPLGEVLFSDPTTRRLRVEIARITPRHRLFQRATDHMKRSPGQIWGRRTLFSYGGERILVNELFLPGIPAMRQ